MWHFSEFPFRFVVACILLFFCNISVIVALYVVKVGFGGLYILAQRIKEAAWSIFHVAFLYIFAQ